MAGAGSQSPNIHCGPAGQTKHTLVRLVQHRSQGIYHSIEAASPTKLIISKISNETKIKQQDLTN